jgi:hypothetical protein
VGREIVASRYSYVGGEKILHDFLKIDEILRARHFKMEQKWDETAPPDRGKPGAGNPPLISLKTCCVLECGHTESPAGRAATTINKITSGRISAHSRQRAPQTRAPAFCLFS